MTMNKTGLVVTKDFTDTADQEIGSRVDVRQRRQYQQINSHLSPFHTIRILKRAPGTKFLNLATIFFAMIKFYYFSQKQYHNCVKRVPLRAPSRQFFTQKFWVKSESTLIFWVKIWVLSVKSRQILIHGKSTHLEKTLNFTENAFIFNWCLFSGMHFLELWWKCGISWVFNLPSVGIHIFSLKFD